MTRTFEAALFGCSRLRTVVLGALRSAKTGLVDMLAGCYGGHECYVDAVWKIVTSRELVILSVSAEVKTAI